MSNFFLHKYGRADDVDAATDIYDVSTGDYEFPTVAFQTEIVGGASDDVTSDGIHGVQVEGLDINYAEISEVTTLTGATPVVLANSYFRVNRAFILSDGGNGVNSFDISVSHTGSATLARINAEEGQTLQAVYTMPAGVSAHVISWHVNAARVAVKVDVQASMRFQTRKFGESWRTKDTSEVSNTQDVVRKFQTAVGIELAPRMDIRLRCVAINTDNVAVSGGWEAEGFRDIR